MQSSKGHGAHSDVKSPCHITCQLDLSRSHTVLPCRHDHILGQRAASLIPPSRMVAPNRELANIQNFSFKHPAKNSPNNNHTSKTPSSSMEVDDPTLRGRSQNISHNQQRSLSTESTESGISKASSMDYADRMQIQNHQSWAEQLENEEQNTPQINMPQCHNKTNSPLSPHTNNSNHSVSPPDLEPLAISY